MFRSIQPGRGLGFSASKLMARGLGTVFGEIVGPVVARLKREFMLKVY